MRLTVSEVASLLDAELPQVYDWIEDGGLPAQRVGGQYLVNRTELLEWTTGRDVTLAPRAFAHLTGGDVPSAADALRDGSVSYGIRCDSAAALVAQIVDSFGIADGADRDAFLHFILGRDSLGLAIVGDRIAIPEVRTPAVLRLSGPPTPRISLSLLDAPLKLGQEARLVETVFFIVSPSIRAHLGLLAKLAWCLDDGTFRKALRVREDRNTIIAAAAAAEARP